SSRNNRRTSLRTRRRPRRTCRRSTRAPGARARAARRSRRTRPREPARLEHVTATTSALIPVPAAPEGHEYRRVTVEPVAGACGAVIDGIDLAHELDDEVVGEMRRAILDHKVVFFRGQELTPHEQVVFSRRFGPYSPVPFIEPLTDHPEVIAVVREASETQRF